MWSLLHNNGGSLKGRNLNPVDPRPGQGQASGRGEAMMMAGRGKGCSRAWNEDYPKVPEDFKITEKAPTCGWWTGPGYLMEGGLS